MYDFVGLSKDWRLCRKIPINMSKVACADSDTAARHVTGPEITRNIDPIGMNYLKANGIVLAWHYGVELNWIYHRSLRPSAF